MLQGSVLLCHSQKERENVNTRPLGEGSYSVGRAAPRMEGFYSVRRAATRMGGGPIEWGGLPEPWPFMIISFISFQKK